MATLDFLKCKYKAPNGDKVDDLFVSSINFEYRHEVDSKHTPGTNKISAKDNGVGEKIHSMDFYFFNETISEKQSMEITDAVYNGKNIPELNIKNASVYANRFHNLLQKIGMAKLTLPTKEEIKVIPLSVTERVDLISNIGVIVISVTFQQVDSIMKDKGTTKDSQTTKDDIANQNTLVTNCMIEQLFNSKEHGVHDLNSCYTNQPFSSGEDGFRETPVRK